MTEQITAITRFTVADEADADVDRLIAAITTLVTAGPTWTYATTDGLWNPTPETRPLTTDTLTGAAPCLIG
ncbi:hypothetical protein ACWDNU_45205, partial [Amycolatopsis sp. NPDC003676]